MHIGLIEVISLPRLYIIKVILMSKLYITIGILMSRLWIGLYNLRYVNVETVCDGVILSMLN